jgi:hypothetical protein
MIFFGIYGLGPGVAGVQESGVQESGVQESGVQESGGMQKSTKSSILPMGAESYEIAKFVILFVVCSGDIRRNHK